MDITQFPYFSYNDLISKIEEPLVNLVDIKLLALRRCYLNKNQFIIITHPIFADDYYSREFYLRGYFEKCPTEYLSRFHMWDHLPHDPSRPLYHFAREVHGLAHGLTITKQHQSHCDFFVFATHTNNSAINNFYLNQKDIFEDFVEDFYRKMDDVLKNLSHHTFTLPGNTKKRSNTLETFSPRQLECGNLMAEGLTNKEIAKVLQLSPRTVETYINTLKAKCGAKNRAQLTFVLRQSL